MTCSKYFATRATQGLLALLVLGICVPAFSDKSNDIASRMQLLEDQVASLATTIRNSQSKIPIPGLPGGLQPGGSEPSRIYNTTQLESFLAQLAEETEQPIDYDGSTASFTHQGLSIEVAASSSSSVMTLNAHVFQGPDYSFGSTALRDWTREQEYLDPVLLESAFGNMFGYSVLAFWPYNTVTYRLRVFSFEEFTPANLNVIFDEFFAISLLLQQRVETELSYPSHMFAHLAASPDLVNVSFVPSGEFADFELNNIRYQLQATSFTHNLRMEAHVWEGEDDSYHLADLFAWERQQDFLQHEPLELEYGPIFDTYMAGNGRENRVTYILNAPAEEFLPEDITIIFDDFARVGMRVRELVVPALNLPP